MRPDSPIHDDDIAAELETLLDRAGGPAFIVRPPAAGADEAVQ